MKISIFSSSYVLFIILSIVSAIDEAILDKDLYKILGVTKTSSNKEIKKAYRKLAQIHHPDKNFKNKQANDELFLEIASAYEILSNPESREEYDALRNSNIRMNKNKEDYQKNQKFRYQVIFILIHSIAFRLLLLNMNRFFFFPAGPSNRKRK